ncbi:MAG: hypothetical protein IKU60_05420 [Clostridia bacterium]|nr:hypothetical protein [Clostridia bacterium]
MGNEKNNLSVRDKVNLLESINKLNRFLLVQRRKNSPDDISLSKPIDHENIHYRNKQNVAGNKAEMIYVEETRKDLEIITKFMIKLGYIKKDRYGNAKNLSDDNKEILYDFLIKEVYKPAEIDQGGFSRYLDQLLKPDRITLLKIATVLFMDEENTVSFLQGAGYSEKFLSAKEYVAYTLILNNYFGESDTAKRFEMLTGLTDEVEGLKVSFEGKTDSYEVYRTAIDKALPGELYHEAIRYPVASEREDIAILRENMKRFEQDFLKAQSTLSFKTDYNDELDYLTNTTQAMRSKHLKGLQHTERITLLKWAVALMLDFETTQRVLEYAGHSIFNSLPAESVILAFIRNGYDGGRDVCENVERLNANIEWYLGEHADKYPYCRDPLKYLKNPYN